jgi:hypothetical protein
LKRWIKRAIVLVAAVLVSGFVCYKAWLMAYAPDIEFAILSQSNRSWELKVSSPTGPSDDVLARLRKLGIKISRKAPGDYGIDLAIIPTGFQSARVQVDELYGPLTGSGYYIFVRRENGVWIVDHVEESYQV